MSVGDNDGVPGVSFAIKSTTLSAQRSGKRHFKIIATPPFSVSRTDDRNAGNCKYVRKSILVLESGRSHTCLAALDNRLSLRVIFFLKKYKDEPIKSLSYFPDCAIKFLYVPSNSDSMIANDLLPPCLER